MPHTATQRTAAPAGRVAPVTAAQIRAAMFGATVEGVRVVRQAARIGPTDTDELALLCVRSRSWWVACRRAAQLRVWAFAGDDEALAGFERMLAEEGWHEARRSALAG